VLDILVRDRRNGSAAKRFFKRLLHGLQSKPRRIVTDGLRSYGVARGPLLPNVVQRSAPGLYERFFEPGTTPNSHSTASPATLARVSKRRIVPGGRSRERTTTLISRSPRSGYICSYQSANGSLGNLTWRHRRSYVGLDHSWYRCWNDQKNSI
jgi:hypothetical protein